MNARHARRSASVAGARWSRSCSCSPRAGAARRPATDTTTTSATGGHRPGATRRSRRRSARASPTRRSRSASRSSTSSASRRTSRRRASTSTRCTTRSSTTSTRTAASPAARSCPSTTRSARSFPRPRSSLCTQFTEDEHVFAVIGDFVDLTGQAQPCIAKQHKTVLITHRPHAGDHRLGAARDDPRRSTRTRSARSSIRSSCLQKQHTLDGKKVAVLGEATTQQSVKNVLVPGLKKMGVDLGTTAILTISGSDTTAASAQLESFIEKWKTEGVDTVFLSGLQVSAQQFVPDLVKAMPGVQLHRRQQHRRHVRPEPAEGRRHAQSVRRDHRRRRARARSEYDQSANWKTCAAIYEKYFHKKAPDQETVIPGPERPHARHQRLDHRRVHRAHDAPRHRRAGREVPEQRRTG